MPDRDSASDSDDSGDCSRRGGAKMNQQQQQQQQQPSCSKNSAPDKRNRRIIMRIEFNDSDDTDEANPPNPGDDPDLDARPSCSTAATRRSGRRQRRPPAIQDSDSDAVQRRSTRNRRNRYGPQSDDCSSSGSEIEQRPKRLRGQSGKRKKLESDEEEPSDDDEAKTRLGPRPATAEDPGFSSDSSSNELLEKCPICLFTFRQQEIGTPATCEHNFCAPCIEAWSKNVQTCPIDRITFDRIVVRDNYADRNVVREVRVDLSKSKTELALEEEEDADATVADVTNCEICHSPEREDVMLLCDSCNQGYHMDCLEPALSEIPEGSWYCDECIDSNDENSDDNLDLAEDLNMLYEDIRGMGLPETRLRVREVQQQPRILRTRQNERIRAAVLRRTRAATSAEAASSGSTTTRTRTTRTTTTTTTTTRTTTNRRQTTQRRRRRRTRHRTYVVEYDLNNFDEKFALKTTSKKVIRRRRRRRRRVVASSASDETGRRRLTASKRLAEQLGVKADGLRSYLSGGNATSFTLFGNANDLEYFSDSEGGQDDAGGAGAGLGATAVQTSVRIASVGNPRTRKALLQGKARTAATTSASSASDILSSILDLQDRWHGASRNLSEVQIRADGSLNLPQRAAATAAAAAAAVPTPAPAPTAAASKPPAEPITQAPLYQRGGAGPNFSRGGGGGGSGNRYGGNSNYNRGGGGGGGNQYQRHSTGGDGGGGAGGQGGSGFNQNFNNNNPSGNNNVSSFTPFHLRFNTPNRQQQQQQQRNQHIQQQQQGPGTNSSPFRGSGPNNPAVVSSPATNNYSQRPPMFPLSHIPAPVMPGPGPGAGPAVARLSMPAVLTVPPPPTPPASLSWNSPLFKLSTDYAQQRPQAAAAAAMTTRTQSGRKMDDDDDDADNCPNFSIYSQESQAVANATALPIGPQPRPTAEEADKEDDDMNEDLVQLDDDDDDEEDAAAAQEDNSIPLPPEKPSDLYEPENPTEEQEEGDSNIDGEPMEEEEEPELEPRAEPEPETERISSNSNSNLEPTVDEDEETKTHSTPSPSARVRDRAGAEGDRGKGVLELYDDSDWEELDIDKPKEFEKALDATTEVAAAETPAVAATSQLPTPAKKKDKEGAARNRSSSDREPDRSYTPCLDEKGDDDDDEEASAASERQQADVSTSPKTPCSKSSDDEENAEQEAPENIGTELISEDDLANENDSKQRRSRSRSRRRSEGAGGGAATGGAAKDPSRENESKSKRSKRGKDETFKKVSKRPKERNYRGDKQTDDARSGSRRRTKTPRRSSAASRSPQSPRGSRSPPQPHSRSRSRSRSPSRSRSRSPIRSRNRRRPRGSRSKSYSRSRSRSRSHSNGRHGRSFRGRDFQRGGFQRGRGGLRFNYNRNQQQFHNRPYQHFHNQGQNHQNPHYFHNNQNNQYHMQNQSQNQNFYQRPKRRELARYDVRNVVGAGSRHNMPTAKDRYGRDAMRSARSRSGGSFERRRSSHSPAFSRSGSRGGAPSRSRSRSPTPKRLRSFSISPSPPPGTSPHRKQQRRRSMSPGPGRRYVRSPSASPPKQRRESPPMHPMHAMERGGHSPISLRSGSHTPTRVNGGRNLAPPPVYHNSPRYTPRLSRSRTRSKSPKAVTKKKKKKADKKKKNKKRTASTSPTTAARMRRISRQRDPFEDADDFLAPQKKRRHSPPISKGVSTGHWSPSPSLSDDHMKFIHDGGDKNSSWTPPLGSPKGLLGHPGHGHYADDGRRSVTPLGIGKKAKRKRDKSKKKKKPIDKLQRKEKKNRKRRTQTPEPIPSKEVFASGNNILVSVSFNKEPASGTMASALQQQQLQQQQQQQTVVTMPALRHDDLLANRLTGSSMDRLLSNASVKPKLKKDKIRKRKKLDAKPVAIIDLERSPFQVHQEPADVIVLTDSEDANEAPPPPHPMRRDRERESRAEQQQQEQQQQQQQRERHQRRRGSGVASPAEHHDLMRENGQREKTPQVDSLATIMETSSYETLQQTTGPKTPPEPPIVKFNLPAKKQHNVRSNPLHEDADDINSADELEAACSSRELPGAGIDDHDNDDGQQQQQQPHGHSHDSGTQKIGPNTPPESGPCSPDAYDPFEPTKSPSLSPRSPTPEPTQNLEQALPNSSGAAGPGDKSDSDSHSHSHSLAPTAVSNSTSTQTQTQASGVINPVDLVMALMNKPNQSTNAGSQQQEKAGGKACDVVTSTQYLGSSSSVVGSSAGGGGGGGDGGHDKTLAEGNTITVLSNVLLSGSSVVSSSQHIPVISSPTPLAKKLTPLPKAGGGSVASSSSCGIANLPTTSSGLRNGGGGSGNAASATVSALDDSFTMDIESPYSPGSADYEDLFEPPQQQRSKGGAKTEMFDNLFGSTSPVGNIARMSRFKKSQRGNNKGERKSRKGGKSSDDHKAAYDDLPNSATDLQNKDRFLRKLNRQERVVEEVKLVLKPHFNKKVITKEDYKDIMRRAVPKICHSRSGEINPHKIKNLIDAYVRKFRAKHKKLSLLNTGQVSSAVKCAAYLKKL
ncbi:serine/arginine repetitive matrix protein 2 [Drosophila obscura]|uniref:serine/arginine repetitive matrix protein 2 n=1 Tax=Drosophila obscura TaxID=7282 RepID=UPI001BB2069B|nr:serine/arginine repetitive matrix protein 2 [Drosophila obscura]XP_022222876.2 serine/arginine repetitive matrix protein 2 [Drosophila obscura]